ncbi:flagellar hook-associated family protein [Chelativorans alearense]|uniref:flagellar hook-associated family protein n=1 Tax=Chelativorans alearense TaxID=2681495 RepID=UPI0013D3F259|nr:flagellar hook-associated family protein [Chelativorans alearense]
MKTSFISTSSISQTLRYQMMRMQVELAERQQEATTGRVADPGVTLGARAGVSFSMTRDMARLDSLIDANGLASGRLSATQNGLEQLGGIAQDMLEALTAASSGDSDPEIIRASAKQALESMTSILNSNLNGEYLFAGINTDVKPLNDFTDPASPNKAQFDTLFSAHFGFAQTDPAAENITAAEMAAFLDDLEASFMGAGWSDWSEASDQKITSRITLNETAETSTTANGPGMRRLAMATAALTDLMQIPLDDEALQALYGRATALVGAAVADFAHAQSEVGLAETRVEEASERISSQIDLFNTLVTDLEGVDPFEAATKVNDLLTQIETAYALTARIQQLSLLRYL